MQASSPGSAKKIQAITCIERTRNLIFPEGSVRMLKQEFSIQYGTNQ